MMQRPPNRERGSILIVSIILLLVITVLAVSGMTTSAVEERMSGNLQESSRALQAAESGALIAFSNPNSMDLDDPVSTPATAIGSMGATHLTTTQLEGWSPPPPASLWSATKFQAARFRIVSTGTAGSGARRILSIGAYQITPKL